jgi:hypothetical protein
LQQKLESSTGRLELLEAEKTEVDSLYQLEKSAATELKKKYVKY